MKRVATVGLVLGLFAGTFAYADTGDRFFDSDGVKIRYIDQGKGEPVMLIHGFTASLDSNWRAPGIISALSKDFRVIALDNRGHGQSGKPHGGENYGTAMVDDVIRLLDHLDLPKAHIVGYSMGGFMTINLLVNHPDRVLSAVPGAAGWNEPGGETANSIDLLAESLESGKGFAPLIDALTPAGQPKPSEEQIQAMNNLLTAANDVQALAGAARGMAKLVVTKEQLQRNKVPTLSIIGGIDPLKAGVEAMASVMSNLEVVVVDGADHMNCFTNPKFLEALKGFISLHGAEEGSDEKEQAKPAA